MIVDEVDSRVLKRSYLWPCNFEKVHLKLIFFYISLVLSIPSPVISYTTKLLKCT